MDRQEIDYFDGISLTTKAEPNHHLHECSVCAMEENNTMQRVRSMVRDRMNEPY